MNAASPDQFLRPPIMDRLLTAISAGLALTALLGSALFTLFYGHRLSKPNFIGGLVWLQFILLLLWGVLMLRYRRLPEEDSLNSILVRRGGSLVTAAYAGISVLWMAFALSQASHTMIFNIHWTSQLALMTLYAFVMGPRFLRFPMPESQRGSGPAAIAIRRRDEMLQYLDNIRQSAWMNAFAAGSTGARLRIALGWWHEELMVGLQLSHLLMADQRVHFVFDECRRETDYLAGLADRNEQDERALLDAERRVLSALDHLVKLIPQLPS